MVDFDETKCPLCGHDLWGNFCVNPDCPVGRESYIEIDGGVNDLGDANPPIKELCKTAAWEAES